MRRSSSRDQHLYASRIPSQATGIQPFPCIWPHVFTFAVVAFDHGPLHRGHARCLQRWRADAVDLCVLHPGEVGEATLPSYTICLPSLVQMTRPHEPLCSWQHASVSAHGQPRVDQVHLDRCDHMSLPNGHGKYVAPTPHALDAKFGHTMGS